jgi:ATP-binding cassette subfamily B protein
VGGVQVATGQITVGSIQAFIQYVRQFNGPLSQVAGMYNALQSGVASAERVFDLLDEPEESSDHAQVPLSPNGQGPRGDDAGRSPARGGAAQSSHSGDDAGRSPARGGARQSQPSGRVEFEHVSFGYHPGTPVIDDLSLVAEPGNTVAIVGATGVGKTTLVNLLMRFYDPNSGRIPGASEDEVVQAARAAYVDRFVHTLPDGYQTRVSDDGGNISAGETQLITIARAFIARPQLLILDEATSSVDTRTELLIAQATHKLRRDRTSFVIAHRLSTIRDADLILVMEAGRIVEQGNHAELLARRGAYWEMAQA